MANQQAAVTVTGFVAGDPTLGGTESFRVLTFRMGSTRSRLNDYQTMGGLRNRMGGRQSVPCFGRERRQFGSPR